VSVETILLLSLAATASIALVHWLDERTGVPAAILLTLLGIAYSLLPGPNISLDPHVVLTFVLPPLLYSAALDSSLLAIRKNVRTVVSLSVVLVLVTAVLIGVTLDAFVTGLTLSAGIALGACVAPPDPVAALAVGRRVGLPPNLITLIHGEGGQGGGVVEQPLTLDERDQVRRQPHPTAHRQRGHRVGRGHAGTERDAGREGQPRHERIQGEADRDGRDEHEHHRQADDGAYVLADREQRGVQRGAVEQGRQDEGQHDVRVETDVRPGQQ
jgi:hypothetical protein